MQKSLLFLCSVLPVFWSFFLSAAISQLIRHASSTLWIDFCVVSVIFLLASRQYAVKLKRNLPQPLNVVNESQRLFTTVPPDLHSLPTHSE